MVKVKRTKETDNHPLALFFFQVRQLLRDNNAMQRKERKIKTQNKNVKTSLAFVFLLMQSVVKPFSL